MVRGMNTGDARERTPWGWLAGLTLAALALRMVALDQQLWYDEMLLAVRWAPLRLWEIVTTYTSQNQHMLYSVLARVAMDLFGESNWALRLPAVLFGVLTVPALYFCARQVTTQRESLLAAALLAVSYHHVWFSQNARGYTGLALWTVVTTYLFLRGLREGTLRPWLWYGVTLALGMYTHLTMGFVAAGHVVVLSWAYLSAWKGWRARTGETETSFITFSLIPPLGFVLAGVLTLALYAPVLPQVLARTVGQQSSSAVQVQSAWTNPLWLVLETLRGLAAGAGGALGYVVLPMAGAILLAGLVSYWRQDRYVVGLMVIPGVITAAVMLFLEHNLWPRFFFFAIGFGMMLLVRGAMRTGEWVASVMGRGRQRPYGATWGTALVALMIVASAWSVRSAWMYPKQDFAGALQFVESQRQPGEPVALAGLAVFPYREYYKRDWPAVATRAQLDAARVAGRRLWLVYASPIFVQSRQPEIWNILGAEFDEVRVFRGTMGDGAVYVCRSKVPGTTDEHR
jgi:mannosyltransferase